MQNSCLEFILLGVNMCRLLLISLIAILSGCSAVKESLPPSFNYTQLTDELDVSYVSGDEGVINGLWFKPEDVNYWLGCNYPMTEKMKVIQVLPDLVDIQKVVFKRENGELFKFDDIQSNLRAGTIRQYQAPVYQIIKPDAVVSVTFRYCGSGGFLNIEKVETVY